MFYTYVLKSEKDGKYYIGHTADVQKRLKRHNSGLERSTKARIPFKLIFKESFKTKQEAYRRELIIKGMKGGIQFKNLITEQRV